MQSTFRLKLEFIGDWFCIKLGPPVVVEDEEETCFEEDAVAVFTEARTCMASGVEIFDEVVVQFVTSLFGFPSIVLRRMTYLHMRLPAGKS